MIGFKPKPNPFVSGYFQNGRLFLVRKSGSVARCDVIIVKNTTLTDNGDTSFDLTFT